MSVAALCWLCQNVSHGKIEDLAFKDCAVTGGLGNEGFKTPL